MIGPPVERLSAENVRPGLRICNCHAAGQDRTVRSVVEGRYIECTGVVSGRASAIDWKRLSQYDIVGVMGS